MHFFQIVLSNVDKGKAWEKKANNDTGNIKNEDYYEMSFNL